MISALSNYETLKVPLMKFAKEEQIDKGQCGHGVLGVLTRNTDISKLRLIDKVMGNVIFKKPVDFQ